MECLLKLAIISLSVCVTGEVLAKDSQKNNQSSSQSYKAQQNKIADIEKQLKTLTLQANNIRKALDKPIAQSPNQNQANSYPTHKTPLLNKKWQIESYGSVRYKSEDVFRNTQDVNPTKRSNIDLERVVLEFVYNFDPKWQVELELEYEHGGTGATLEYDGFEEFGEFETEIEAGGEVIVEKLQVRYQANEYLSVKMGRIFVPVGLGTDLHKPHQYMTAERHWSEATMIPQTWNESGVNVMGRWNNFTVQALLTTGLNSEYFRTYNWAATGHQKRFEQVNADDLAITLRLDYGDIKNGKGVGFSYYTSNTTGNRNNQNNIQGDGNIQIFGIHGVWALGNWLARGQYLFGQLDDSEAITRANKTTPGLKPGNFSLVGSESESSFVELGYNAQTLLGLPSALRIFGAFDYANPIKKVENGKATSRFNKQEFSLGINYIPIPELIFKAQVSQQQYAQDNLENTHSVTLSMGYFFSI